MSHEDMREKQRERMFQQTSAYINAGGRGTRLEPVMQKSENGITKALVDFDGEPVIQKHINLLSKLNFKNIIVGAGDHLNVKEYLENSRVENLEIAITEEQEGTGGDLIKAVREMRCCGKNVLVENVDTLLCIKNLSNLFDQHEQTDAIATIVLTTRKNVPNEGAFFVDENNKVVFSKEARKNVGRVEPRDWKGFRGSSTGAVIFKTEFLRSYSWHSGKKPLSIYQDIIPDLIDRGEMYAYNNGDALFVDIGTPKRYHQIKRHEKTIFNALGSRYLNQ